MKLDAIHLQRLLMAVADWQRAASKNRGFAGAKREAEIALLEVLRLDNPHATADDARAILESARVGEI